jgi:hypothetical protein
MISNQIIQEALIRLKRSGKKHIFLSEHSKSQLRNIHFQDMSEPENQVTSESNLGKKLESSVIVLGGTNETSRIYY